MGQPQPWMRSTPLYGVRVSGDGPLPAQYMFIGERPGKNEPKAGRPFVGAAGMELDRYLALAGLKRREVYVTNLVKDYIDDDPTESEVERDLPELLQEISDCAPLFIIPLGRYATRFFLGEVDMEKVHGLLFDGEGYGYPGQFIYPCFHPAAGLYSTDTIPYIHDDFHRLAAPFDRLLPRDVLRDGMPSEHSYREHRGTDLLIPDQPLGLDSEGYRADPWSIQYSQAAGEGRIVYPRGATTVPEERGDVAGRHGLEFGGPPSLARSNGQRLQLEVWNMQGGDNQPSRGRLCVSEWAAAYARFWSAGGHTLIHNSLHDLSVLPALGVYIHDGGFTDTMVLAYLLCTYPQGLKPLAFRLAGMEMDSYEEVVAPARRMVQEEWLAGAVAVADSIAPPEPELVWDDKKANWRMKQPQTVAQRLRRALGDLAKADAGGKLVDIAKRVGEWDDSAAQELTLICGPLPEPTLRDIPKADAEHYACRDADATVRIYPHLKQAIADWGLEEVAQIDHAIIPMVNMMQEKGILIDPGHFLQMDAELTQVMSDKRDEIEELVGVRINPGSSPQVAQLLFKQLGLPSRKLTRGGDDSTQDKVLEGLRHEHPVLPMILDYREWDKIRGSFCRKMPRLAGPDGRVRGNIRITRVHSGRLAMNTPNLMAIPVRSALGRRLREGFIARPGCVIGNWDLDQIEMREIADVSGDALLLELFSDPSRDIHSETAARMFDKAIADIDAKTERYAAKRVGFGIATQITGRGLVDQMELAGATHADGRHWTEPECDNLIELWFGVYPGVRRFIDRTKARVRRTGIARDRWGRMRHLEGVWSSVDRVREEALRQGPSHVIQAGAQGVMKRNMARIWSRLKEDGLLQWVWPILQIHDSLMLEYPEELHPLVDEIVMEGMEQTCAAHYRIPITASGEHGYNWGQMDLGGGD